MSVMEFKLPFESTLLRSNQKGQHIRLLLTDAQDGYTFKKAELVHLFMI